MYKVIQGDCHRLLASIPDSSIDMVLTDPPYGTTQCAWDSVLDFDIIWPELIRVTKPNAATLLMAQTPYDKVLGCTNLKMLRYEWIWEKTAATGFLNAKKMPLKAHENILVFYKSLPSFNPVMTRSHSRKTASRKTVTSECYGKAIELVNYDSTSRYPRSVQIFNKDKQRSTLHPTQKPVALMEYLIKTYSNEGDTVLDFTMGSGSTGVAAIKNKRNFAGIELDKSYHNAAENRILETICEYIL